MVIKTTNEILDLNSDSDIQQLLDVKKGDNAVQKKKDIERAINVCKKNRRSAIIV